MDHGASGIRRSQQEPLASRWTKQQRASVQGPEEEIIYLHLPSPTSPGETYIFPLALCPSFPPEKKRHHKEKRIAWDRLSTG
jgi:hypothetical protein